MSRMICWTYKRKLSAYLDNALSETECLSVRRHLSTCSQCAGSSRKQLKTSTTLRSLPRLRTPAHLAVQIRVSASRESHASGVSHFGKWVSRLQLAFENMMRPMALPLFGGLASALILFGVLVPTFTAAFNRTPGDVPTVLFTEPTLKGTSPIGLSGVDATVDLRIDEEGRIVNYAIVGGKAGKDDFIRHGIENDLLFTTFQPATSFGMPTVGNVRLSFRSSRIEVKG